MPNARYGLTPPRLIPFTDGSSRPTDPNGGRLSTYDAQAMEAAVLTGVAAQDLCTVAIFEDRVTQLEVWVEAYDPLVVDGGPYASAMGIITARRLGAGAIILLGSPLMLSFNPNVAPWNTLTADLVVAASTTDVVVRTTGVAALAVRWKASIKVVGAQVQQVT